MRGDICTVCCGTEREVTVTCPLDCEYLQDARRREKPALLEESEVPNQDIPVSEKFLQEHEELLWFMGRALSASALDTPGVVDYDVRETLEALIRTYRSLQSGVYYETRPENALAQTLFRRTQEALAEYRAEEQKKLGLMKTRDSDILALLVFLQRLELDRNNGRRRGRAFLSLLDSFYAQKEESEQSPLVLP